MRGLLLIICIIVAASCPEKHVALDCFYDRADANHDQQISRHELKHAIMSRLPWWKRAGFKLFGGVSRILKDCDLNHDGVLTKEEAYAMPNTCMNSCYKRTMTIDLFKCK